MLFFSPDFVHSRFGLRFCHTSLPSTLPPTKISSPPLCYRAWCHDWLGSNRTNHGTLSLLKASLASHMVRVLARLSALARNLFGKKCSSIKYQFASYNPTVPVGPSYKQNVWSDLLASSTRRTRLKNMIRPIKASLFIASFPVSRHGGQGFF